MKNLYEDNIAGKISNERFSKFLETYENEQKESEGKLNVLKITTSGSEKKHITAKDFEERRKLTAKYIKTDELDSQILTEPTDRIEISQGCYDKNKVKQQSIKIYYKFCAGVS